LLSAQVDEGKEVQMSTTFWARNGAAYAEPLLASLNTRALKAIASMAPTAADGTAL
jgi:hypothetical protein